MDKLFKIRIPLEVFWHLKEITVKHKVRAVEWARASNVLNIRISEYARMYKITRGVEDKWKNELRRAFTLEVALDLFNGLKPLISEPVLGMEIDTILAKEKDQFIKLVLMLLQCDLLKKN